MEIQLSTPGECSTRGAISTVAPAPLRPARGTSARTRLMSEAGVYHVPAFWGLSIKGDLGCDAVVFAKPDQQAPFTHNFTTRQGPPTCSPPV